MFIFGRQKAFQNSIFLFFLNLITVLALPAVFFSHKCQNETNGRIRLMKTVRFIKNHIPFRMCGMYIEAIFKFITN